MGANRPGRGPPQGVRIARPAIPAEPAPAPASRPAAAPSEDLLSGPVDVCVAVPRLALDRPFTYLLPEECGAGTGSFISVPFHGRTVPGWVLGPAEEVPPGRLLPVRKVRSRVRFFDGRMLELLRWVAERSIAPLATVIERSHPPRVASEERDAIARPSPAPPETPSAAVAEQDVVLPEAGMTTWVRPLPEDEVGSCLRAVASCLNARRRAIVLVPEAEPRPATAAAVLEEFAGDAVGLLGGDARHRYRAWLEILAGRYRVVVGTRPAVFAPIPELGLVWVSREVHPAHREDRVPYYHVRDVAMARGRIEGAACVLASLCPSVETVAAVDAGEIRVRRPSRHAERASAPLVETTQPEAEDRSPRLAALLKAARSGALIVSRRGYGVARVCKACGQPAACASCRGPIVVEEGAAICRMCRAPGRCAYCGGSSFGVERGGVERIAEWASRIARTPVHRAGAPDRGRDGEPGVGSSPPGPLASFPASLPAPGILVGTSAVVNDVGPVRLDLVAILDPDRALARPGLRSGEQALATWMEAAAWAGPRDGGGRVLAQTRRPAHAAVQALVRWEPVPFLRSEAARRAAAGFPAGHPVFRIAGPPGPSLEVALREAGAHSVLATGTESGTVCLVAVRPAVLPGFRQAVVRLAAEGIVERVGAEPHL